MEYEDVIDVPKLAKEVTDTSRVLSLAGSAPDAGPGLSAGVPAVLVSMTVVRGATQDNVTGPNYWATIKDATGDVIVEAKTQPNTVAAWKQIKWSGDSGSPVPGMPNQRRLSRATSTTYHVVAELGGMNDTLSVWVLWAEITILTDPEDKPENAAKFGWSADGTEDLGVKIWQSANIYIADEVTGEPTDTLSYSAAGKIAAVAKITPYGINKSIMTGWTFERQRISHDWRDGVKYKEGETKAHYWNTQWVTDISPKGLRREKPDDGDKIYDIDAPNIELLRTGQKHDYETYNNFRQWVEWNGQRCSDDALWYWKAQWQRTEPRNITLSELGTGNIKLPDKPPLHP